MKAPLYLSLVVLCTLGCNSSDKSPVPTHPAKEERNISYGPDDRQRMDVYFPEGYHDKTPVVFLVHGGGLVFGSRDEFSDKALLFRNQGFITVNVSYRLVDTTGILRNPPLHMLSDVMFTDILDDMDAAIARYKALAASWNTSSSDMYMAGHSAGAILSMVYTLSDRNTNRQIKACGNWAGVTDLTIPHDSLLDDVTPQYKELMYRITGAEMNSGNQLAYMYISAYWQANNTGGAPTLSIYPLEGTEANVQGADAYNLRNTRNFHLLLDGKNQRNKLVVFENSDHSFDTPANAWQIVIKETADFFRAN